MNKNQKRIRKMLHTEGNVEIKVPSGGYHNSEKGAFHTRTIEAGHQPRHSKRAKVAGESGATGQGPSIMDQMTILGNYKLRN